MGNNIISDEDEDSYYFQGIEKKDRVEANNILKDIEKKTPTIKEEIENEEYDIDQKNNKFQDLNQTQNQNPNQSQSQSKDSQDQGKGESPAASKKDDVFLTSLNQESKKKEENQNKKNN